MQVNYQSAGDENATTLILHSSLGCSHRMWDPQVPALVTAGLRVVRYDYRGHGDSPEPTEATNLADYAQDVLELMDTLKIDHAIHVGLSIGGMVSMWLAENAPDRVVGLVLVSTSAQMGPSQAWRDRAAGVREAGSTEQIAAAFLPRWVTPGFSADHPDVVDWLRELIMETTVAGYAGGCDAIANMDLLPKLGQIAVPTSVVVGEQDPGTPAGHSQLIVDTIPGATLTVLDPGAHLLNVEQVDGVTKSILDLVKTVAV